MRLIAPSLVVLVAALAACAAPPAVKAPAADDGGPSVSLKPAARPAGGASPTSSPGPKASPATGSTGPTARPASTSPFASPGGMASPTASVAPAPAASAPASAAPAASPAGAPIALAPGSGPIGAVTAENGILQADLAIAPDLAVGEQARIDVRVDGPALPGSETPHDVGIAHAQLQGIPAFTTRVQVPLEFLKPDTGYLLRYFRFEGAVADRPATAEVRFRIPATAYAPAPVSGMEGVDVAWKEDGDRFVLTRALPADRAHDITAWARALNGSDLGVSTRTGSPEQMAGTAKTLEVDMMAKHIAPGTTFLVYVVVDGRLAGKYRLTKPAP